MGLFYKQIKKSSTNSKTFLAKVLLLRQKLTLLLHFCSNNIFKSTLNLALKIPMCVVFCLEGYRSPSSEFTCAKMSFLCEITLFKSKLRVYAAPKAPQPVMLARYVGKCFCISQANDGLAYYMYIKPLINQRTGKLCTTFFCMYNLHSPMG